MRVFLKDPGARVEYSIDWGALRPSPLQIVQSDWTVRPQEAAGVAIGAHGFDGRTARATIEGGRVGAVYDIANRVTLASGESDVRSISFRVDRR